MLKGLSLNFLEIIALARNRAKKHGNDFIGSEHLLLGIMDHKNNTAMHLLEVLFKIDIPDVYEKLEKNLLRKKNKNHSESKVSFSARFQRIFEISASIAINLQQDTLRSKHLLTGIIKESAGKSARILIEDYNITYNALLESAFGIRTLELKNYDYCRKIANQWLYRLEEDISRWSWAENNLTSQLHETMENLRYAVKGLDNLGEKSLAEELQNLMEKIREICQKKGISSFLAGIEEDDEIINIRINQRAFKNLIKKTLESYIHPSQYPKI